MTSSAADSGLIENHDYAPRHFHCRLATIRIRADRSQGLRLRRPLFGRNHEKSANLWVKSIFREICRRLIEQELALGRFLARRPGFGRFDNVLSSTTRWLCRLFSFKLGIKGGSPPGNQVMGHPEDVKRRSTPSHIQTGGAHES